MQMLSTSKRIKLIPKWYTELSIASFLTGSCYRRFHRGRGHVYLKRIWGVNSFLNGYMSTSCHLHTKCITSTPVLVPWICPFFAILGTSIRKYQSFTTIATSSEEEMADQVLNQILSEIENAPSFTKEIITNHIKKLCTTKNLPAAARLLQSLHDKDVPICQEAYNILLAAASGEDDIELVLEIFKDMLLHRQPMNSASYLTLAKAFSKSNDSTLLLKFVKEVLELTSSVTVVNRTIYAFAECGQVDKALLLFDQVKRLKCKSDLITYNTVLWILGRAARVDEMLREFASMKEVNIVPDIISYNTILNSLRKVGRLDLCLVFLTEMGMLGLEPDLRTYTALIESFGRAGNVEESLRIFDEMKCRQIRPSIYIYRSLISNLKRMGKLELAVKLTEEMNACLPDLIGPKDFKRKDR